MYLDFGAANNCRRRLMSEMRSELGEDSSPKIVELMRGKLGPTPMTVALVGINIAVFGAMLMHGAGLWHSPNGVQLA